MRVKSFYSVLLLITILALTSTACGLADEDRVVVEVTANPSLTPWLQNAIEAFNEAKIKTSDDKAIRVKLSSAEAGQAVADMVAGADLPTLWIPDAEVWANVLAERGQGSFQGNCVSVAQSPLIIAMWRPVAESLGWPGRSLGWLDIGSLAADPSAWAYYSGGQFGPALRLGHTHPGLSGTGASTLLAIVQAAESKSDAVSVDDIQKPIVQASVSAFEGAVAWFSSDTDRLAQTMYERGVEFMGAAVMYENQVVSRGAAGDIVPVYPFEGTFIATHPACVNGSASDKEQEAATLFRDYLLGQEAQGLAVSGGLRPVNEQVAITAPLDAAHGVDLSQPEIVFNPPSVETIYAVQNLWQEARKDANVVLILDISGSMEGSKLKNMRRAAVQFVEQMGDDDFITVIAFNHEAIILAQHLQVGPAREPVIDAIESLDAYGDTALYDAIGAGAGVIADSTSSQATNVLVVLTDGKDNYSGAYAFDQRLIDTATANDTTVFTIAYGSDAEEGILASLADYTNGNFYRGTEANIAEIYQEMSAAFGGSAGIGR